MSQDTNNAVDKGISATEKTAKTATHAVKKSIKKHKKKAKKAAAKSAAAASGIGPAVLIFIGVILALIIIVVVFGTTGPGMSGAEYLTANNEEVMNEPKEKDVDDAIYKKSVVTDETAELISIIQEKKDEERENQVKTLRTLAKQNGCDPDVTEEKMVDDTGENITSDEISASSISASSRELKIWKFLKALGFSDAAAAGIMGNFKAESGCKPDVTEIGSGAGYGLAQWTGTRRVELIAYAKAKGKKVSSLDLQLDFMAHELKGGYATISSKKFKNTKDYGYAAVTFMEVYEICANQGTAGKVRTGYAKEMYKKYHGMKADGSSSSGSGTAAVTSAFYQSLTSYAQKFADKKFHYDGGCGHRTYNASLKSNKSVNCAAYVSWALQESGLAPKRTLFWCSNKGEIRGPSAKTMRNKKYFYTREHIHKTVKSLVASGDLKPGDIVGSGHGQNHHTMVYKGKIKGKYKFFAVGKNKVNSHVPSKVSNATYPGKYMVGSIIRPKNAGTFSGTEDFSEQTNEATLRDFELLAAYSVSVGNGELELKDEESASKSSDGKEEDDKTYTDITGKKIPLYWWGEKRGLPNYKKDLKKKLSKKDTPFYSMTYASDKNGSMAIKETKADGKKVRYLQATLKARDVTKVTKEDKSGKIKSVAESAFSVKPNEIYAGTGSKYSVAIKGIGIESFNLLGAGKSGATVVYGNGMFTLPLPKKNMVQTAVWHEWRGDHYHAGIDLGAPQGTPIYAVADGVVTRAEWFSGYGYCVDIDHGGGLSTRYGHMPSNNPSTGIMVKKGAHVKKGQQIGHVGNTGNSTGPHLHFEVRKNGVDTNPKNYFNGLVKIK